MSFYNISFGFCFIFVRSYSPSSPGLQSAFSASKHAPFGLGLWPTETWSRGAVHASNCQQICKLKWYSFPWWITCHAKDPFSTRLYSSILKDHLYAFVGIISSMFAFTKRSSSFIQYQDGRIRLCIMCFILRWVVGMFKLWRWLLIKGDVALMVPAPIGLYTHLQTRGTQSTA